MSENRPRLHLIDAYANIFRAFYAIRNLSNTKGEPTNAIFGFLQILRKILREEDPRYIGVAFDVSSDTVRKERYAEYKAQRAPMPEDLRPQIPWIRKILDAYKIPLLELEKYEADDVLGTISRKAVAEGYEVVLWSADKDLFQLVGDGVVMQHTGREKIYDPALVEEDFGVPPSQVVDVLALMGDSSDNVPGVPGIGGKGAVKLIKEHGSLEALLDAADSVKRKSYREGLQNYREQALLSQELVTIHTDLDIPFEPEQLVREEPDWQALIDIFWELDFNTLVKDLEAEHGRQAEPFPPADEVKGPAEWQVRLEGMGKEIHLGAVGEPAVGLAVMTVDGPAYADFDHDGLRDAVETSLRAWCADPEVTLIGHDLKEVLRFIAPDLDVSCRLFDTMLVSYVLMPALKSHALAAVSLERLRRAAMTLADAGWKKGARPVAADPALLAYAAEQVELPRALAPKMSDDLDEAGIREVYETIEAPLVAVLADMEERGIGLDVEYLRAMSQELRTEIAELEEKIYAAADERFNLNSPAQLGEILFEKLGYPSGRKTRKTKNWSTDAETLEGLAAKGYDVVVDVLRYRELSKLEGTYVNALPELVADDGRIHTRFYQAVAATGRLSSAHPNLQNIPVRSDLGQKIRHAFGAKDDWRLVVADYSQIELRVLAHIAEEQEMIEAFRDGSDIHAATAAAVFGGSPMLINPEQRRMAKAINFGIIYGMSAFGLARQLGISKGDAQKFIDAYMERYPGVARYTEETLESARETHKVETLYGRVRWLPDIKARNWNVRNNAERMAINARIQGTAADLLKLAMIAVDQRLRDENVAGRMLLTVHDELVFEAPEDEAQALGDLVRSEMEGVAELAVPLVVDVGVGPTWDNAKS